MDELKFQAQINDINHKLDMVLEHIEQQRIKREEIDDLIDDLSIVGKDAFQHTVVALDKAGVELDSDALSLLAIKIVKNIGNFNELLDTIESVNDFIKDATPIFRQIGLDAINKVAEFEEKGYLEYFYAAKDLFGKISENYSPDDIRKLSENVDLIFSVIRNITKTEFLQNLEYITKVISETKIDDSLDNKSIFKLMKELNSPEIRKSLSYVLRITKQISNKNN
jgi:uncharacterized protein YjgD (DUF1641 family)